jgi:hypothetical protein
MIEDEQQTHRSKQDASYLESDSSSDDGRSGVTRPLASATVQGEGMEAWCSREGGGNGGGVAQSLAVWTLRSAT